MANENTVIVIDTPEGLARFHKLQCYYALKLEVSTGLSHSQGSVMNLIKTRYLPDCTKRTKAAVLAEYEASLKSEGVLQ